MDRQNWEEEANIDTRRVQAAWRKKPRIFLTWNVVSLAFWHLILRIS